MASGQTISRYRARSLIDDNEFAPRSPWNRIEADLKDAFTDFLRCQNFNFPTDSAANGTVVGR
jgi:hypothetical protein